MSYEIYEGNLVSEAGTPLQALEVIKSLEAHWNKDDVQWVKQIPGSSLRTFLFRARRAGLNVSEILEELRGFTYNRGSFSTSSGRLNFIEALMRKKALKTNKPIWGGKTQANLFELHDRNSDGFFFIMVRDIRDVFASMSNNGSFRYTAKEAADLWKRNIMEFREFVSKRNSKAMEIRYENFAIAPETVLGNVCKLIGVDYSPEMLRFHEKKMTLFENPHGHLSNKQLQKGLNFSSIGRWKGELSTSDANVIMSIAGDLLDD